MVHRSVYEKIPQPHYLQEYIPELNLEIGEDIYFCKLAQAHGFKVYIDHDLSKEVRHTGTMDFTHEHAEACREDSLGDSANVVERIEEVQSEEEDKG
jgi:hypothetical protein